MLNTLVLTEALRPPEPCLSSLLPSFLPFSALLPPRFSLPLPSHFSGCPPASSHKLQTHSCVRAFDIFLLPSDIQIPPALPSFKSAFICHLTREALFNQPLQSSRIKMMIINQFRIFLDLLYYFSVMLITMNVFVHCSLPVSPSYL